MTGRPLERRVKLTDRLAAKGSRKLLAIDGAGIRAVLSLMIQTAIVSSDIILATAGNHHSNALHSHYSPL